MPSTRTSAPSENSKEFPGCSFCIVHKIGLCGPTKEERRPGIVSGDRPISIHKYTIHERQTIYHPRVVSEFAIFICNGTVASSLGLPDGRRQILNILLPGDIVLWTALSDSNSGRLIEAIENSTYRQIKRTEFQLFVRDRVDLFEKFMTLCAQEKARSDRLALALGRRNAPERIAGLILDIADRLAERCLTNEQTMRFPLRLRHIGDATGVTLVHASKILNDFQRDKLIELQNRWLAITDMPELCRLAGLEQRSCFHPTVGIV